MADSTLWRTQLTARLPSLACALDDVQVTRLIQYLGMLHLWNRTHNLTRVPPENWVDRHIVDSLVLCEKVSGRRFLDVGSGAGFPGLPLAICAEKTEAVLLDVSSKRCAFLRQVVADLQLPNVSVCQHDITRYHPAVQFDMVVTRAFASLERIRACVAHVVSDEGVVWAMKANISQKELAELCCNHTVFRLSLIDSDEARCLVQLIPHSGLNR